MKSSRIFGLAILVPALLLVTLFFSTPDLVQSLGMICEMLRSGNASSLQMFYYDGGNLGWLVSIVITFFATLVPMFSKNTVIIANQSYFGDVQGSALVAAGMLLAVSYVGLLLYGIARTIKRRKAA